MRYLRATKHVQYKESKSTNEGALNNFCHSYCSNIYIGLPTPVGIVLVVCCVLLLLLSLVLFRVPVGVGRDTAVEMYVRPVAVDVVPHPRLLRTHCRKAALNHANVTAQNPYFTHTHAKATHISFGIDTLALALVGIASTCTYDTMPTSVPQSLTWGLTMVTLTFGVGLAVFGGCNKRDHNQPTETKNETILPNPDSTENTTNFVQKLQLAGDQLWSRDKPHRSLAGNNKVTQ